MRRNTRIYVLALCCFLSSPSGPWRVFAQGTVIFANSGLSHPIEGGVYNAPVTLADGTPVAGDEFRAGLFLVTPGGLTLVGSIPFRPFRPGFPSGYFPPTLLAVPGIESGSPATFRARVWESGAGYENAVALRKLHGEFPTLWPDNNIQVSFLGDARVNPPLRTDGLLPLTLQVPEPTTAALIAIGGAICFAVKRRKF